mmetsp:Transcript_3833/g.5851  ORF Transcript_3833/g.5851 Transcript_3833/m.5851 type:complete len:122 (+) Transcript_3833:613-978(+)
MEVETEKRSVEMQKQREMEERKMSLGCPLVRGIYSRKSGVPKDCLAFQPPEQVLGNSLSSPVARKLPMLRNGAVCPLVPSVYNILPDLGATVGESISGLEKVGKHLRRIRAPVYVMLIDCL